jgi:hypothetical protein
MKLIWRSMPTLLLIVILTSSSLPSMAEQDRKRIREQTHKVLAWCEYDSVWGERRRLSLQELAILDLDPSYNEWTRDRALILTETTWDSKNPRIIWFAFDSKPEHYLNWEEWVWDIIYHPEAEQAFIIKAASNRQRAKATFSVYSVNLDQTIDPATLQLDPAAFAKEGKPTGAKPLSEITRLIPRAKENTYRNSAAGIYVSLKAICKREELLVIVIPSNESRPVLLSFELRTKKWREMVLLPGGPVQLSEADRPAGRTPTEE